MSIYTKEETGTCPSCPVAFDIESRVDHCGVCESCWAHCVNGEPHYDENAIGVKDRDYGLNQDGELEWVDIQITVIENGLRFRSLLSGSEYVIEGVTLSGLDSELSDLGGSDFTDEFLNMVGEMGGGIWPEADGTSTEYHLDEVAGLLTVIER